jgi:hypothetical protein
MPRTLIPSRRAALRAQESLRKYGAGQKLNVR